MSDDLDAADLRRLLCEIRRLALHPHNRVLADGEGVPNMMFALGLIAGIAERALTRSPSRGT